MNEPIEDNKGGGEVGCANCELIKLCDVTNCKAQKMIYSPNVTTELIVDILASGMSAGWSGTWGKGPRGLQKKY